GVHFKILLNKFLTKARRQGIMCGFIADHKISVFNGAALYNLTDSMLKYNFNHAGKLNFTLLEHEFWNAMSEDFKTYSGITSGQTDAYIFFNGLENTKFQDAFNDHKRFLDTLNLQRFKDANFYGVHDYLDKLFFNYEPSGFAHQYSDTNLIDQKIKAQELEKKSNAIFLVNYQRYWPVHNGTDFLHTKTTDTFHVRLRYHRQSFFGANSRYTYFFPLFSGEFYINDSTRCGRKEQEPYEDFLGKYFQASLNNTPWAVEDTFIKQYVQVFSDTDFITADSVILSGMAWFKYTCIDSYSFNKTDLHPCPELYFEESQTNRNLDFLSISEKTKSNISIYPNPVSDKVFISSQNFPLSTSIFNSQGVLLTHQELTQGDASIYLAALPPGIYVLRILNKNEETQTFKLIKQ
ncbi:MAG: T9SS type A sorting domain-containing protein, partial [Flavobacteriales bacterium]|nr:T9SS type A sorting domain-containing protein [Flavobacteriales bacterium]